MVESKKKNERRLQEQRWYYGLCTRDMVAPLLKKKGDFVVRATQKGDKYTITINVRNEKSVDNFQIAFNRNNEYVLHTLAKEKNAKTFQNVMELIDYYKEHTLPNRVRLHKGIKRPNWLIAPRLVTYSKEDMMGSGNFSDVYRGTVKIARNTMGCAIKVLNFNNENGLTEDSARQKFLSEAKMQSAYKHDNIVAMLGVVLDCPPIMMIMELCCGGSLDKHMQKRGKQISLFEKQLYLMEAAQGMRYLHSQGCIHRDLAARNCLIGSNGRIKISDFGLSLFSPDGQTVNSALATVPLRWMAPECLRREQAFSPKTDVWAYGVLVYEVFSNGSKMRKHQGYGPFFNHARLATSIDDGFQNVRKGQVFKVDAEHLPFADADTDSAEIRMIKAIKKAEMPPLPEGTPEAVVALNKDIWQRDPNARPDFVAIVIRLCAALRKEKPIPVTQLVLAELPKVEIKELPDFDWTEEKEKERILKEQQVEKERRDKKREILKRQKKTLKAGSNKGKASKSPELPTSSSTTHRSHKSAAKSPLKHKKGGPESQQRTLVDENGKKRWVQATLTRLVESRKKEQEKKFEVKEVQAKKGAATPSQMTTVKTVKTTASTLKLGGGAKELENEVGENKEERKGGSDEAKKKYAMIGPGDMDIWEE